ncbi:MAG: Asp23/Gls24 family envelope stress response protein [Defluviitaleaceae bacterium]|nr:Asp23/Gls24 family envelope stress response protein [Defluviitaleaceae bacterium]MCL2835645.1 Asp23/Gls24 family envelope stress response protein [Defluviitaleaceae bacterium]
MNCKITNDYGQIAIDYEVILKIAGAAAMECYGIVGMAAKNMKDGIARLLKKESQTKGISLTTQENAVILDIHVIVLYGTSISVICESLIDTVKYKVEEATGLQVLAVNVFVDGLKLDE